MGPPGAVVFDKPEEDDAYETSRHGGTYLVQLIFTPLRVKCTGLVAIVEQVASRNEAITT